MSKLVGLSGMRSLDQFKSTLGSASNTGGVKPFQFSSARQPSAAYSNSSGSFASLMLTAEKLVKEQASAKQIFNWRYDELIFIGSMRIRSLR
ncbi:hypothetical protein Tco_0171934 [Tanacetum coccineum]